ncbi:hypothetical protein QUB70_32545 [Microcoleus sp. A003_D6]
MPVPQEKITLVERASCPFHQLMKGFLQEVFSLLFLRALGVFAVRFN